MMQRNNIVTSAPEDYYAVIHIVKDSPCMQVAKMMIACLFICLTLSGCSASPDKAALIEKYSNQDSQFLSLQGMQVHYRDEGEGDIILLLHGTASSLHTWDQWTNYLTHDYRVIRLDLPGFGLTGPHPNDRYEVGNDVDFIHNFINQLALEKVHMVGSSLGGRISWEYSLQHSEQVQSLTLINALGYPQASWPPAIEMAQWPVIDSLVANVSPRFMFDIGLQEIYFDTSIVTPELIDRYYELAHYPGNMDAFPKRVKAKLDTQSNKIKHITVPTLILWGEEDLYFPVERAFDFHRDITNSSVITYTNVGHLPMEEVPEKSVNDLLNFLKTNSSTNKASSVATEF